MTVFCVFMTLLWNFPIMNLQANDLYPASYKRKLMLTAVLLPVNLQQQWVSSQGSWKLLLRKWMMVTSSNEWNWQKKDQSSQLQKLHYFQMKQLSTTAVLHCKTAVVLNSCSAALLRNLHRLHTHTNKIVLYLDTFSFSFFCSLSPILDATKNSSAYP